MPISTINGDIILDGDVGDCGFPAHFTAKEVSQALAASGSKKRAKVRLNSGGGIATEGLAIAAAIKAHPGGVEVTVEGIAASAATGAVCAATRASIAFGSIFMVHEASNLTLGTVADHQDSIATLNVLNESMAGVYAAKTRQPVSAMRDLMRAETWMTAEDAVARGFCDAVVGSPDAHPIMAAFTYRAYKHPPPALKAQADALRRPGAALAAQRETWGAIADMCLAKGRPEMAADLIEANVSLAEATKRVVSKNAVAHGRDRMLKLQGLTRVDVDKQRADRGMPAMRW